MKRLAVLSLLCAIALAGCGGLKEGGLTPVGSEDGIMAPAAVQSAAKVEMIDISYSPSVIRIRPGGKVTWTNRDKVSHTVTVGTELYNTLNSGPLEPGERYTRVFNKEQSTPYRCTIHPNMKGTIFVLK